MEQALFLRTKELFSGSDVVRKYSFKTMDTRSNCAPLAKANHQLRQIFANLRDKSVVLTVVCPVQTAFLGLTRGYSAHFKNECFECLSPHEIAA